MSNQVNVPRFFYKTVQADVRKIEEEASRSSLKSAMTAYLSEKADKLPEGVTVEDVVEAIIHTCYEFCDVMRSKNRSDYAVRR